ncbi:methionine--tRNA ligase subunit beta [Candidatus Parcubacteria bacterium]|nr:MAG: methionine--tRNA ligase subunit beta [Candidatus Parcubacteria bacterium]
MTLEEFQKADLRIARVLSADRLGGSEKLVKLRVTLGEEERQIVAGVGKAYAPDELVGKEIVIIANLDPRKLMGEESNGMLLAASDENGEPVLLGLDREVAPGTKIR